MLHTMMMLMFLICCLLAVAVVVVNGLTSVATSPMYSRIPGSKYGTVHASALSANFYNDNSINRVRNL